MEFVGVQHLLYCFGSDFQDRAPKSYNLDRLWAAFFHLKLTLPEKHFFQRILSPKHTKIGDLPECFAKKVPLSMSH